MGIIDITERIELRRRQVKVDLMVDKIGHDGPSMAESFGDVARINVPVRTSMRRQFNVRLVEG